MIEISKDQQKNSRNWRRNCVYNFINV